jgi:peroxiredoxin
MTTKKPAKKNASAKGDGAETAVRERGSPSEARDDTAPSTALPPGKSAPDFRLHTTPDQTIALSDLRGRPVILAFYPADWSPVCGDQLTLYNEVLGEFQRYGAELMGISVDGAWSHAAFSQQRHLRFPLLADFEPKGAVARLYGVYSSTAGLSNRALFVIDSAGTIRWSYVSPMGVNPGADGILAALESLTAADGAPAAKQSTPRVDSPSIDRSAGSDTRSEGSVQ